MLCPHEHRNVCLRGTGAFARYKPSRNRCSVKCLVYRLGIDNLVCGDFFNIFHCFIDVDSNHNQFYIKIIILLRP